MKLSHQDDRGQQSDRLVHTPAELRYYYLPLTPQNFETQNLAKLPPRQRHMKSKIATRLGRQVADSTPLRGHPRM